MLFVNCPVLYSCSHIYITLPLPLVPTRSLRLPFHSFKCVKCVNSFNPVNSFKRFVRLSRPSPASRSFVCLVHLLRLVCSSVSSISCVSFVRLRPSPASRSSVLCCASISCVSFVRLVRSSRLFVSFVRPYASVSCPRCSSPASRLRPSPALLCNPLKLL